MSFKLVRDNHQAQWEGVISGEWRASPDPVGALVRKLGEEYGEFTQDRDPAELHDMLDVIGELFALLDPDHRTGHEHDRKLDEAGAFGDHLEWCPLPGNS